MRRISMALAVVIAAFAQCAITAQTTDQASKCVPVAIPCLDWPSGSASNMGACAGQGTGGSISGCGTRDLQGNITWDTVWSFYPASWHMCSTPGSDPGSTCTYSLDVCRERRTCTNAAPPLDPPTCIWVNTLTISRNRCVPSGGGGPGAGSSNPFGKVRSLVPGEFEMVGVR